MKAALPTRVLTARHDFLIKNNCHATRVYIGIKEQHELKKLTDDASMWKRMMPLRPPVFGRALGLDWFASGEPSEVRVTDEEPYDFRGLFDA